ncbi:MAG: YVTN family beta-propeller protein [Hyphomicrobiaceae bacterium]|jgi:YVTN family beta-propeller protein
MSHRFSHRSSSIIGLFTAFFAVSVLSLIPVSALAFTTFETGQVRPLALNDDGSRLYAVNTPDNTLEIYDVTVEGLSHAGSVAVGLEPDAVAVRPGTEEVWVVNHLSDSVSVVDATTIAGARVVRTLLVGDEPRDIVFGGTGFDRAFITCAHRGQNVPFDPQFTTDGIGRADVWVFDADALGVSLGGDEIAIVNLFSDTPRALAVTPDGTRVYAAAFHSGNQTTSLNEGTIANGGDGTLADRRLPPPSANAHGEDQPEVGLIVKFDPTTGEWNDELGRDWAADVNFNLPDEDVFVIDADANPPVQLDGGSGTPEFAGVGTILFNMAVNPVSGNVYVSNTEAFNEVRFEGPGVFASTTVRSHLHETRITVIDPDAVLPADRVTPIHLNKHIDYDSCCDTLPNETNDNSLAFPVEMAVNAAGTTLFVSAFGSAKIGIFDVAELEGDTFTPSAADHIELSAGGPTGLVIDESRSRLYTLTRFDNGISVLSTGTGAEVAHVEMHNPEPDSVVAGRPFLYDARFTSSNGDQACASCHVFGDFDSLAWDLGNPDEEIVTNPGPFSLRGNLFIDENFHSMKGPMTTQSFRGMDNHGPMHWRGDRTGGNDVLFSTQPDTGSFDERAAFRAFNGAFVGLIGRSEVLTDEDMDAFTEFVLQVMYPPNPIRSLDNSLTVSQQAGRDRWFGGISDTVFNCDGCHTFDPTGNSEFGVERPGFFGGDGRSSFENETQMMKIPHLRNVYQKVGMFGLPVVPFIRPGDNGHKGDQVRGFGFLHDGAIDTVFRFFDATVFAGSGGNPGGFTNNAAGDAARREMEDFSLAFDSNLKPIVGQQITLNATNSATVGARIDLMLARADAVPSECDVVVSGIVSGDSGTALYVGGGFFQPDRVGDSTVADGTLRAVAAVAGQELTYTAVPPGDGQRIGLDRDADGFFGGDERDGGSDPANELSLPCASPTAHTYRKAKIVDSKGVLALKAEVVLPTYVGDSNVQLAITDLGDDIFDSGAVGAEFVPNQKATKFVFKGPRRTPGIVKVVIKVDKKVVDGFKVIAKTKKAWTAAAGETEATTLVRLNVGGACFEGNATKLVN